MADGKDEPPDRVPDPPLNAESAFDIWLRRSLHKLFDDVANEVVPPNLLKLIEDDEKKAK